MAQLVEHILGKDEVTGSTPVSSSKKNPCSFENYKGFCFPFPKFICFSGPDLMFYKYKYEYMDNYMKSISKFHETINAFKELYNK